VAVKFNLRVVYFYIADTNCGSSMPKDLELPAKPPRTLTSETQKIISESRKKRLRWRLLTNVKRKLFGSKFLNSSKTRNNERVLRAHEWARIRSKWDPLTGLYNVEHLGRSLPEHYPELNRAEPIVRPVQPLTLIGLDIRKFGLVNGLLTHARGDRALKIIAGHILHSVRDTDMAVRVHGDELLIAMHGANLEAGRNLVRRINQNIRADSKLNEYIGRIMAISPDEERLKKDPSLRAKLIAVQQFYNRRQDSPLIQTNPNDELFTLRYNVAHYKDPYRAVFTPEKRGFSKLLAEVSPNEAGRAIFDVVDPKEA
jgi:diguanylate cyclase (GGDEF)-like protein